jgi:hypothetical protein
MFCYFAVGIAHDVRGCGVCYYHALAHQNGDVSDDFREFCVRLKFT